MQTIFHANRKTLNGPRFVRVYTYEEHGRSDGIVRYMPHRSREEREDYERSNFDINWWRKQKPLYRVNVHPKS